MRITDIRTFHVDAGWRCWLFVKVETDDGITGWGECSDDKMPLSIEGAIEDLKPVLVGKDPRPFEMRFPEAILKIRQSTNTPICTGENLFHMRGYIPYFERHAADVFMVDVPWNGFSQSKKIGDLAEVYQLNVAPHNYYSHLASFISASHCAVLPNVRIMEIDIDDVPWKDDLVTDPPRIVDGHMAIPNGPGWGTDVVEEALLAHPRQPGRRQM